MTCIRWVYGVFCGRQSCTTKNPLPSLTTPVIARREAPKQSFDARPLCVGVNGFFIKRNPSCFLSPVSCFLHLNSPTFYVLPSYALLKNPRQSVRSRSSVFHLRSEERRVGKECRSGWWR